MLFSDVLRSAATEKRTENGALAHSSSQGGALLDLYAQIGALRPRDENEIIQKFRNAFDENKELAMKMLFYARDCRVVPNLMTGLGERRTFRIILKWLGDNHPDIISKNLANIPYYGRYDDLFVLINTKSENKMWSFVKEILSSDMRIAIDYKNSEEKKPITLLAKWMPSENTSSQKTRILARRAIQKLDVTARNYRKMLSILRSYLEVVEKKMSSGEWTEINYKKVPSYAMKNYGEAFANHDEAGFSNFLNAVKAKETKINASTLYPYDLVRAYGWQGYSHLAEDPVLEAQWKALPNYVEGENNFVIMADVSGSMSGRPMDTSVGLATYFAQHNHGPYKNLYMTFTDEPHFVALRENASLAECLYKVRLTDIGYNTNLQAAFMAILRHAINFNIAQEDMPKALVIISDMEIDPYMRSKNAWSFIETMRERFAAHGYVLPKCVLWNVEARNDTYLSQSEDVIFVSGQSASVFKQLCGNLNGKSSYELMIETLSNQKYDRVKV